MNSVNNRRNHDFQILHFLVGSCHTPDGAYALLCDLREERRNALETARAGALRAQATISRASVRRFSFFKATRLEAKADFLEIDAMAATVENCVRAAQDELGFIESCMLKIGPYRKYKHLPLHRAHEEAQRDEWKFELIRRAENFITTAGTLPADEFNTMRMHPDFDKDILPVINRLRSPDARASTLGSTDLVKLLLSKEGQST